MRLRIALFFLGLAAFLIWLASASLFVVGEGQQALVIRLGAPLGVLDKPGLKVKAPLVDSVYIYDTRLLLLTPPKQQVILGDQKRLEVEPYARYRIVDPLTFYQALRTDEQARAQLSQLVSSSLRRELGHTPLAKLLTAERVEVLEAVRSEVAQHAKPLGVAVDQVRFHRADLPAETSQAIYDRMKSERQREAKELRAQGYEWAQQIDAKADRERTGVLAEAQGAATALRGAGDAEASRKLSAAFSEDEAFYEFYRTLQTYKHALADTGATLLLTPSSAFLKLLISGPPTPPANGASVK